MRLISFKMTFLGKILGFFLGWLMAGPMGALIGIFIGSVFDQGLKVHLHQAPRSHTVEVQQAFFKATFTVMGHLAKADGRIVQDEIRVAKHIMQRLELNEELKIEAIRLFNLGKDPHYQIEKDLDDLYREAHRFPELLHFFIEIQLEAAKADGPLQDVEQKILLFICERLRVDVEEFDHLMQRQWASQSFHEWYDDFTQAYTRQHRYQQHQQDRYQSRQGNQNQYYDDQYRSQYRRQAYQRSESSLQDAYGVLGVHSEASIAEIKKSYRKLMNQHHPDKLVSRGLPEGMIKLAQEKTQEIRAAYDLIREAKGFK